VKDQIKEIDVKMTDIDGKMKQYAETFLNELVDKRLATAETEHASVVRKSFEHQLHLEELAKKCEEQTALLEEYKIRHGQDTATAKQLSQLVEQKDEEVKKFSNELTQLKTGLEKVELRLSETVGERGSVNNWESNQRKIDEDNEAKFARLQVIQGMMTNFESLHIPEMKTIYEQVKKTYATMEECMEKGSNQQPSSNRRWIAWLLR
jgi:chromosome segregation ATPase